jgi:diadenosine tetraphosphate (Ap4A) HIT family hydrolase
VPDIPSKLPDFVSWPSFPFEGDLKIKPLDPVAETEPPRDGEDASECVACAAKDEAYIWVSERWRVRAMDRPSGLPMVLILESRSHLDLGDLPNLLAAELGVMTVRLERAVRSLDDVARVHVNRWGDGAAHLHLWFLARPHGRLQLRGSFLSLWDEILPPISEERWRESLALVAAWLAEFGGRPLAEPPRIAWQAPATFVDSRPFAINDDAIDDDPADDSTEDAPAAAVTEVQSSTEQRIELPPPVTVVADPAVPAPREPEAVTVTEKVAEKTGAPAGA